MCKTALVVLALLAMGQAVPAAGSRPGDNNSIPREEPKPVPAGDSRPSDPPQADHYSGHQSASTVSALLNTFWTATARGEKVSLLLDSNTGKTTAIFKLDTTTLTATTGHRPPATGHRRRRSTKMVYFNCAHYNGFIGRGNNVIGGQGIQTEGATDCAMRCTAEPDCQAWTLKKDTDHCWLKKSNHGIGPSGDWTWGLRCTANEGPAMSVGGQDAASCALEPPLGEPCDHTARYRTFSGRCNNLVVPASGSALQLLHRLLPASYQDSVSAPRTASVEGPDLPDARLISLKLHQGQTPPDTQFTLALMQWGQFIDHDITATPQHRGEDGGPIDCSACHSAVLNPACFPVARPPGLPGAPCFSFVRSLPGQQGPGPRQQLNQITSFLDASMVYGSDACVASQLRVDADCLLRTAGQGLLPTTEGDIDCRAPDGVCFLAGDGRVNEQPGLTGFHTVLLREHNGIAKELGRINPSWAAERVFQEARRVVAALVQHVTFSEFLPRVLGLSSVESFGLDLLPFGYYKAYDADCSANIFNEFATAAFRFGHSLIGPNITLLTEYEAMMGWREGRRTARSLPLRQLFHDPSMLRSGAMPLDSLLRGLVLSPMMPMDLKLSDEVVNHLFEEQGKPRSGIDLAALNIQRGRDHGLLGYNSYRPVCGLPPATAFSDLLAQIPAAQVTKLAATYRHPDDIDLFPGLLSESLLPDAMVGPTLACILARQFANLRQCDRYWYETADPAVRFSPEQLRQIRGETLAGLLCRNMDQPGRLPGHAMDQLNELSNGMVDCAERVHRDLEAWREAPGVA